jgi:hypothetical protein
VVDERQLHDQLPSAWRLIVLPAAWSSSALLTVPVINHAACCVVFICAVACTR